MTDKYFPIQEISGSFPDFFYIKDMKTRKNSKTKNIRHWIIVILMCCLAASSIGLCTNSIGVFYVPVSESLHVMKGTFAMHATLSSLFTAFSALFMPKLMRRCPYRFLLAAGVLLAAGSTLLMAFTRTMTGFYILGILRGIGLGTFSMVPLTIIITNWFQKSHGLATSIALSFSGLSGAVFSPLLSGWISRFGWQKTYLFMAVFILVLTIPALVFPWHIRPQEENLLPYGYEEGRKPAAVLQNSSFRCLTVPFLCMCIFTFLHTSITGISQHVSGMAESVALSAADGALMMSLIMIGNISTKLLIGFLSDLLNPVRASLIMIGTNILSLFLLYAGMMRSDALLMFGASLIFGSIYSVGAVGIPLLTRWFFGAENYQKAYSVIGFLTNVGSASSLALIGYVYDFSGSYLPVLVIALLFHLVNIVLLGITAVKSGGKQAAR